MWRLELSWGMVKQGQISWKFLGIGKDVKLFFVVVHEFDYEVDLFTVYVKVARHLLFNLPLLVLLITVNGSLDIVLL